jgi:hypothetical protein
MWQRRYEATALPSSSSQMKCLKYLLGHGVKEGLVESPLDWPRFLVISVPFPGGFVLHHLARGPSVGDAIKMNGACVTLME